MKSHVRWDQPRIYVAGRAARPMLVGLLAVLVALLLACPRGVAAEPAWAMVNGVSLRYRVDGTGRDVILLLPSTGKPLEYWDEFVPSLMKRGRMILRYDIRGSGLSQKLTGAVGMQDMVDDLKGLLDTLNIQGPVTMIGTAFGGSIELQFAAQNPQRVRAIINVSPSAQLVGRSLHPPGPQTVETMPAPVDDPYAFTYPTELRSNAQRWQRYVGLDKSNDPLSKRLTEALIYSTPFADVMPRVQCPVLMVATTLYRRRTPQQVEELSKTLPKGEFAVIESGHDAPFQTPERIVPLVQQFLKRNGV